jgi:hypothetical protein
MKVTDYGRGQTNGRAGLESYAESGLRQAIEQTERNPK